MIHLVSRRAFLGSTMALAAGGRLGTGIPVICSLEESRRAFKGTAPFGGVLVESGVGFAADHLAWLRLWGISVGQPRDVEGPAWVRFDWPVRVMIRDFARVCPVSGGTVIARLGDLPVAVRQGSLVVLGSPLGPHLYAGDFEAGHLLRALIRQLPSG